ncbi:MAG: hypothetical protein U1E20_14840 [Methylocystis sp.]|uniref:hypothetical protein n=1 Tax=Methylocystis sp. TaxID=1911079 RepID=UPI0039540D01
MTAGATERTQAMRLLAASAAILILSSRLVVAEDAPITFQCEGSLQQGSQKTETPIEPFSVEIKGKVVTLTGVGNLGTAFSLIQKDQRFYVFKNAGKDQGGNIDRQTGVISLYVLDKSAHKISASINGRCR